MTETMEQRKLNQLDSVLTRDVSFHHVTTGFEKIQFEHSALPDLDCDDIDLGTVFLGRALAAPLLISSMTGGPQRAGQINRTLAEIAQGLRIALAVGSQRIALETGQTAGFDLDLRRLAPDIPILANIGAAQLRDWTGTDMIRRAVEMIDADALIIHLNPLQEVLQDRGDRNWSGLFDLIEKAVATLSCPVVVKEVGCGISAGVARRLEGAGVRIIDIAGAGGTSWAAVVADSTPPGKARNVAETFREWGIPTARALVDVRQASPQAVLIASGGMRNGLDAAKAIRLGADMVGYAAAVLPDTLEGPECLSLRFETIIDELRIAAFCTGSASLAALKDARLLGADRYEA